MADMTLDVQVVTREGIEPSTDAVTNADDFFFTNAPGVVIDIECGGTAGTLTIARQVEVDGAAVPARVISIGANERRIVGPFPPEFYNDDDRQVEFEVSEDMTVSILKV